MLSVSDHPILPDSFHTMTIVLLWVLSSFASFTQMKSALQVADSIEFVNLSSSISTEIKSSFDAFTASFQHLKFDKPKKIILGYDEGDDKPYIILEMNTKNWGTITELEGPIWFPTIQCELVVQGIHQVLIRCVQKQFYRSAKFLEDALSNVTVQLESGDEALSFVLSYSYDGHAQQFYYSRIVRVGIDKITEFVATLKPFETNGFILPDLSSYSGKTSRQAVQIRTLIIKYCTKR
jgi:hypothetical protein